MNYKNYLTDTILKYILYFFPLFIIIGNGLINFAYLVVVIIYLFQCFDQRKILYKNNYEFNIFIYFYIYLIINSLLAENILESISRTVPYIKYFIFIIIFKNFINEKKIILRQLGLVWLLIIFILSLDIIYQSYFGYDIFNYESVILTRNSGFFFDELIAGGYLLCFSFTTFFLVSRYPNYIYFFLYLIFFLIVISLTGERSNFLKAIFVFSCIVFFLIRIKFIHKIFTFIVSILLLFFLLSNLSTMQNHFTKERGSILKRYISSISFSSNQNLSLVDKYLTSEYGSHTISAYLIFQNNLFFGVGNKNFRNKCHEYQDQVIQIQKNIDNNAERNYPSGCATHPHQIYNEILSEHGLIGMILLTILFYKLFFMRLLRDNLSHLNYISLFYLASFFLPILPSGSFFSTLPSTFFWINYLFYIVSIENK